MGLELVNPKALKLLTDKNFVEAVVSPVRMMSDLENMMGFLNMSVQAQWCLVRNEHSAAAVLAITAADLLTLMQYSSDSIIGYFGAPPHRLGLRIGY